MSPNKPLPSSIVLTPFSDFTECPPPPCFVISDLVVEKGVTLLVGAAGIGKSTLALNAAVSVANGKDFLGYGCIEGSVIFVNPELSSDVMARRAWEMCEQLGCPTPDDPEAPDNKCKNIYFLNLRGTSNSLDIIGKRIAQLCTQNFISPKLIVVDSLYMLASGDENDASNVTRNLLTIGRIAEETGAGVIVTHHTTKGSQLGKSLIDRASGSGAFGRYVDVQVYLGRLDSSQQENGTAWRLEFAKTRHTAVPEPVNLWLDFPLHKPDTTGTLVSARYADEAGVRHGTTRSDAENKLSDAHETLTEKNGDDPTIDELASELGSPRTTVDRWVHQSSCFKKYKIDGERAYRVRFAE